MELRRLEVRAALGLLLALALTLGHVDAAEAEVHANEGPGTYVVQPGETLTELAERFGVSARALMRTNGIQHPRELYPGQTLTITGGVPAGTLRRTLAYGEDLLALTRAADLDWAPVARLGGVLLPTRLEAGHTVSLPADAMDAAAAGRTHWMPVAPSRAPRVVGAVRHNVSLWEMLTLNRLPVTAEQWLAVPMQDGAAPAETGLPYPVTSLRVSPQPMQRGETAAIAVETAAPVTCRLRYLDRTEVCYPTAEGGHAWHGLVGLPTMMATGPVTVTVELETEEGAWLFIPVPMVVSAGRYDYERLDLPADRQALLDPQLS
ncbi:MAG: LysM peptidoglycan-binding domain-containing protein, partial [Anaerolineae bacterium]